MADSELDEVNGEERSGRSVPLIAGALIAAIVVFWLVWKVYTGRPLEGRYEALYGSVTMDFAREGQFVITFITGDRLSGTYEVAGGELVLHPDVDLQSLASSGTAGKRAARPTEMERRFEKLIEGLTSDVLKCSLSWDRRSLSVLGLEFLREGSRRKR